MVGCTSIATPHTHMHYTPETQPSELHLINVFIKTSTGTLCVQVDRDASIAFLKQKVVMVVVLAAAASSFTLQIASHIC